MVVLMDPQSTAEHVDHVVRVLNGMGLDHCVVEWATGKMIEVFGNKESHDVAALENAPMVKRVLNGSHALLAADRKPGDRTVEVPLSTGKSVGGRRLAVIAGPCSVESESQLLEIAVAVKEAGAAALRGGAFKPRTSPYSFQGHGERGLEMLARARAETGLAVVTEVTQCAHVELVARYADVLQVGSRNMHNPQLLAAVGRQPKPVLLKRGWCATLQEFLLAAEYVMAEGNRNVILCERGIRTHERYVRNTLALSVVPEVKRVSTRAIVVDPSHGTGRSHLVAPMSNAAIACGADGLLIEVHCAPRQAWTDGEQSLDCAQFRALMKGLKPIADASGREL